jgi:hypothetical protein
MTLNVISQKPSVEEECRVSGAVIVPVTLTSSSERKIHAMR